VSRVAIVVDDSMTIRKLVGRVLQQAGFEILEASNGREAMSALEGCTAQVIITDVNMPVMNGLEFIREIRATARNKFTPVIFLTTESEASKKEEAYAAGATAWVLKPFSPEKVMSVVQRVVPQT
jgi:two-component system, chemotaxis family, chemotaxis protein CheY